MNPMNFDTPSPPFKSWNASRAELTAPSPHALGSVLVVYDFTFASVEPSVCARLSLVVCILFV